MKCPNCGGQIVIDALCTVTWATDESGEATEAIIGDLFNRPTARCTVCGEEYPAGEDLRVVVPGR